MSFTGKSPANTYKDITYVDNSNSGVTTTIKRIKTGEGSDTSTLISDRALKVLPSTDNTGAFEVNNASNANKFRVGFRYKINDHVRIDPHLFVDNKRKDDW